MKIYSAIKMPFRMARSLQQKLSIRQTIKEFDRNINASLWCGADFHPSLIMPIELSQSAEMDGSGLHNSRDISTPIAELTACVILKFKPFISQYLGLDARLDDLMINWFDPSCAKEPSVSGSWHDDNVGHRLKLFICLEGNGTTPTVIIPDSHKRPYSILYSDLFRHAGKIDSSPKQGEMKIRYRRGDVALFDTHCLHRGLYEEGAERRVMIIAEFINRHKSDVISGRAPCGPGSSRTGQVLLELPALAALRKTGLIDELLICESSECATYSIKNKYRK
jgi:hypothetical protein